MLEIFAGAIVMGRGNARRDLFEIAFRRVQNKLPGDEIGGWLDWTRGLAVRNGSAGPFRPRVNRYAD
jgi:hypothetical protein